MLRAAAETGGRKLGDFSATELDSRAICLRYRVNKKELHRTILKRKEPLGTIFLQYGDSELGVVAHEIGAHAAIGWARAAKVNPLRQSKNYWKCPEERFARTVQFLFEQFYKLAPAAIAKAA